MASTNPDSMTNAQGEFKPSVPRDEPLTTKGHQVGQKVGNDAAPEFSAEVHPPGTAPKENTFKPNPINEIPGQANNPDARQEGVETDPLDMPGATSGDVHRGIGKPVAGESGSELHHDGQTHRKRDPTGLAGVSGSSGGSGMAGEMSQEARRLQEDHTSTGPATGREHNVSLDGAESKQPVDAEQLASDSKNIMQDDYLRRGEKGGGLVDKK